MLVLTIGDVHATVETLDDCQRLHDFVVSTVRQTIPDAIVYMGDLYHNHALKNVEVEKFWVNSFQSLHGYEVFALVGNHDRPGNASSTAHSLQTFKALVTVVDRPTILGSCLLLPYYHNPEDLVKAAVAHKDPSVLFAHQTFDGAIFDNGFYAKEAISPDFVPQNTIISGHIHTPHKFGKVQYIGSPRWQTLSDANVSRAIHLFNIEDDGKVVEDRVFSTDPILSRIWALDYTPTDLCERELAQIGPLDKVVVNIKGPQSFCEESKKTLQSRGFRVRLFPTDRGTAKVSEASGIKVAWAKHVLNYSPKFGTSKGTLQKMIDERIAYVR